MHCFFVLEFTVPFWVNFSPSINANDLVPYTSVFQSAMATVLNQPLSYVTIASIDNNGSNQEARVLHDIVFRDTTVTVLTANDLLQNLNEEYRKNTELALILGLQPGDSYFSCKKCSWENFKQKKKESLFVC